MDNNTNKPLGYGDKVRMTGSHTIYEVLTSVIDAGNGKQYVQGMVLQQGPGPHAMLLLEVEHLIKVTYA